MKHNAHGFTLIELVVVMVVISVGLLGIARMFGDNISTLVVGEDAQRAAQYAQECAEMVLSQRRTSGYSSVTTTSCAGTTVPTGFTRSVTLSANTTTACPGTCQNVAISVAKGSVSADITVMIVSY